MDPRVGVVVVDNEPDSRDPLYVGTQILVGSG